MTKNAGAGANRSISSSKVRALFGRMGRLRFLKLSACLTFFTGLAGWAQDAQELPQPEQPSFDPDDLPSTKAYRSAVRVRGVGVKIGEVSATSAIVWARVPPLDEVAYRRKRDLLAWLASLFVEEDIQVRFRYGTTEDLTSIPWGVWTDADVEDDFTKRWELTGLKPATTYYFEVEGADENRQPLYDVRKGRFKTAPALNDPAPITFTVVTCQRYDHLDNPRGYEIYPSMEDLEPSFTVLTGDSIYFDRGPMKARTLELARDRWRRMYELPRLFDYHALVPAYWEKDDHDTLSDEAGPTTKPFGELTFEMGAHLFKLYNPVGEIPYQAISLGPLARNLAAGSEGISRSQPHAGRARQVHLRGAPKGMAPPHARSERRGLARARQPHADRRARPSAIQG